MQTQSLMQKSAKLCASATLAIFMLTCISVYAATGKVFKELSHDEFAAISEQSLIVDVRTPEEYAQGHVPGAINIPLATVKDNLSLLGSKDREIVMYCRSGRRAGTALEMASKAGFSNLYHLEGDIKAWEAAGKEIEKPAN